MRSLAALAVMFVVTCVVIGGSTAFAEIWPVPEPRDGSWEGLIALAAKYSDPYITFYRGCKARRDGDLKSAVAYFDAARRLDPADEWYYQKAKEEYENQLERQSRSQVAPAVGSGTNKVGSNINNAESAIKEGNAYGYAKVIEQFNVSTNPRYAVSKNGDTYCNLFAQDVTKAMGAPLPPFRSNDIANWLNDKQGGGRNGWRKISADEAQKMANAGHPALAVWQNSQGPHGHIAIIRPGSVGDPRGVSEAQAGSLVVNATHLKTGFNDKSFRKAIQYWWHE